MTAPTRISASLALVEHELYEASLLADLEASLLDPIGEYRPEPPTADPIREANERRLRVADLQARARARRAR